MAIASLFAMAQLSHRSTYRAMDAQLLHWRNGFGVEKKREQ
jgi:hypothetical protein